MKKTRSSTKILIGFIAVVAAAYFGYGIVSGLMIDKKKFPPIPPGNVNLVGVDTSVGYHIVVANDVAQLVRGEIGEFKAVDHDENTGDSQKKRVPIRELLRSLQGDEKALGKFVMSMNDISDAEFPAYPIYWKAEDLQKALGGDRALQKRLENDLNVRLDGTPVDQIKVSTLEGGIVIDSPVEIDVHVGAETKRLVARIQEQFVPRLCSTVWSKLIEKSNLTPEIIKGYYISEGKKVLQNPTERQDVRQTISSRIAPDRLKSLGEVPKKMLHSAQIIVNDGLIESASYKMYRTSDGKTWYDLILNLSDEGRQRLWQYSKRNANAQLLVTWEGIAIAAPRMQGELALSEVTIKQLTDPDLVKDTVDSINSVQKEKT